jgi:sugar-specific transcriptional regulator TrmB
MPAGAPRVYSPEKLLEKFEEYRAEQLDHTKTVYNNRTKTVETITYDKPLTLAGFCDHAKMHRDTLNSYKNEHKNEYSDIIKRIYTAIERDLVENSLLYTYSSPMAQHILNNAHGYSNKQEVTANTTNINTNNNTNKNFDMSTPIEDIQAEIDRLQAELSKNGK